MWPEMKTWQQPGLGAVENQGCRESSGLSVSGEGWRWAYILLPSPPHSPPVLLSVTFQAWHPGHGHRPQGVPQVWGHQDWPKPASLVCGILSVPIPNSDLAQIPSWDDSVSPPLAGLALSLAAYSPPPLHTHTCSFPKMDCARTRWVLSTESPHYLEQACH